MKKFGAILFTVLFMVICALPVAGMPLAQASGEKLPALPMLYSEETGVNSGFGEEMETYLAENFAGRQQLVTVNARLNTAVFATSPERQVILGEDGWLFYEQTLEDYLATTPLTEREMEDIAATVGLVQEYAEGMGGDFLFTVAPNKNSLYGEQMPYYTVPAREENDLVALAGALEAADVHYYDLYALFNERSLLEEKEGLYHKRDTHWNNAGARLAYDEMLTALGHPHQSFDGDYTVEENWEGDLDRLLYPVNGVLDEQVVYADGPENHFDFVGPGRVDIGKVETMAAEGEGSLLCFRDSFGNALIPFLATAYAEGTYVNATPHTPDLLEPGQTLIVEIVQRNLRVLLTNAPRMPAPERTLAGERRVAAGSDSTLASEETGEYLHVYGTIDEALAGEADSLYLAVEAEGKTTFYEAFPALEEGFLGEEATGRGFSLYIPLSALPSENCNLFPVVQFENEAIIIET